MRKITLLALMLTACQGFKYDEEKDVYCTVAMKSETICKGDTTIYGLPKCRKVYYETEICTGETQEDWNHDN